MKGYKSKTKLWLQNKLQHKRIRSAEGTLTAARGRCGTWIKTLDMKVGTGRNILALDEGRRRLFEHTRDQGEQVETLWESGKTIRHGRKGKLPKTRGES